MIAQTTLFAKIWKNQWKKGDEIEELQNKKVRDLVRHSYYTVPFYRKLLDDLGLHPDDIQTIHDLAKLPILTKEEVKQAGKSILSSKYEEKDLVVERTGGSTGKPLTIYNSKEAISTSQAVKLRSFVANGYKLHQKIATFLFHPPKKKFFHKLGVHRTYPVSPYASMEEQVEFLQNVKPHVFDGFPSKIAELARYIRKHEIQGISPKLVFANSETLQESDLKIIREQFRDPMNTYVSREFKHVAWQCKGRKGLHINEDMVYVEIINPDTGKPVRMGEEGEIVITGLFNDAMPLIRYSTEDIGVLSTTPCTCGRTFPCLEKIVGRKNEFILLPSKKRLLGPSFFLDVLKGLSGYEKIEQFRAIQREDSSIDLYLKSELLSPSDEESLKEKLREGLETLPVTVRYVDEIRRTEQGKHLSFISQVRS